MEDIAITCENRGTAGEYQAHVQGTKHLGKLTWVQRGDVRHAEHTLVPKEIGGRGIAAMLVGALVADARSEGFRIAPECSYVAAAFAKHPDWADLRA